MTYRIYLVMKLLLGVFLMLQISSLPNLLVTSSDYLTIVGGWVHRWSQGIGSTRCLWGIHTSKRKEQRAELGRGGESDYDMSLESLSWPTGELQRWRVYPSVCVCVCVLCVCLQMKWLELYPLPLSVIGCRLPQEGCDPWARKLSAAEAGPEGADRRGRLLASPPCS